MDRPSFGEVARFVLEALRLLRQPALVRCASLVVYAGLGLLTPGLRDLLLVGLPSAINWALERWDIPPLKTAESAPWWVGLVLVGAGLLFLVWHAGTRIIVVEIKKNNGNYTAVVKVPENLADDPVITTKLLAILIEESKKAPPPREQ